MIRQTLHRYFFALLPPPPLAREVALASACYGGRHAARADRLHITLACSATSSAPRADLVRRARTTADAIAARRFPVILDHAVGSGDRVILRPSEAVPGLAAFQADLRAALDPVDFPLPERFSPHMTLFYPGQGDGRRFSQFIDPVSWPADRFVLIHSHVNRTRHDIVGTWPLG